MINPATVAATVAPHIKDQRTWDVAQAMESAFLAEMLRMGGLGQGNQDFGGGIGEAQFAGFLVDEQSRMMVASGGIGLAETIYRSMIGKQD
jgi:Rod binding domain-containing protein